MNIHETHNKYICDEVIRKHTGKILGCKIQDSERGKVNGTGERIQKNLWIYLWLFFLYLKEKPEGNDKIQLCVVHTCLFIILFSVLCLYLKKFVPTMKETCYMSYRKRDVQDLKTPLKTTKHGWRKLKT